MLSVESSDWLHVWLGVDGIVFRITQVVSGRGWYLGLGGGGGMRWIRGPDGCHLRQPPSQIKPEAPPNQDPEKSRNLETKL